MDSGARMARLRELTDQVTPFAALIGKDCHGRSPLNVKVGSGFVCGVVKNPQVAVLLAHYEPHTEFPAHTHDEEEYFIVYGGAFFSDPDGDVCTLNVGDHLHIAPGVPHRAWTEERPCDLLVVTIPANKDFPDAA
jgi:quercetin dioxygenase-like cupin family protein